MVEVSFEDGLEEDLEIKVVATLLVDYLVVAHLVVSFLLKYMFHVLVLDLYNMLPEEFHHLQFFASFLILLHLEMLFKDSDLFE